ncbi:hypothetical protein KBC75_00750 [Candidatus Shapirobacteria bacterium]|nr:hypothetical protein [Candidatus Shapirobacteria bacterium]
MSRTPELPVNSTAKILPIIWLIFLIITSISAYLYFSSVRLNQQFIKPLIKYFDNNFSQSEELAKPSVSKTPSNFPTSIPTIIITPTIKKSVATCYRINIREGEFASNKCYSKTNYDNLSYYLQRFDSANFDLQSAQGTINITCNCRVAQECEFFKNSCAEAQQKKSNAEANISKYRSTIKTIISTGR